MPELPEVTVITNQLNNKLKGLVLEGIEYDWPKKFSWGKYSIKDLKGSKVAGVERLGKIVLFRFDNNITVLMHLKLTGQLIYQDKKTRLSGGHPLPPLNLPAPNKSTRVTFSFTNGGHLYFNDVRKFGWVKIVESLESNVEDAIGTKLGPDALTVNFNDFCERLKAKSKGRIKKTLMDQNVIAGIGNIYSDEGLWRAKIHPKRLVGSLSDVEFKALYKGIRSVLKLAIEKGGSSSNAYVDSGGERGLYLSFGKAYHMTGKPCSRCKTRIVREKIDGRSAHYCPNCQKLK